MKRLPLIAIAFVVALLLYIHRNAVNTFFDGGDLLRLVHFRGHSVFEYLAAAILPNAGPGFEQPFAALLFGGLSKLWLGSPKPYLIALAAFHLLNLILVLAVSRQLDFGPAASTYAIGAFGFHAGVTEMFWQPGAVSQAAGGTLVLASILAWLLRAPVWSALAYWLALQFDLTAFLLPAALFFLDRDRVKDLLAHAVILLYAFVQLAYQSGLLSDPAAMWRRLCYYADELIVFTDGEPILCVIFLAVGALLPGPRIRSAYLLFVFLLLPLIFTARPLGDHNIYIPLIGAALFLGRLGVELGFSQRYAAVAFGAVFWLLLNVFEYNRRIDAYSGKAFEARRYAEDLLGYKEWPPDGGAVLVDGAPPLLEVAGVRALLQLEDLTIPIEPLKSPKGRQLLSNPSVTYLNYTDGRSLQIFKRQPGSLGQPVLHMKDWSTVLQLGAGWVDKPTKDGRDSSLWMLSRAEVFLHRPAGTRKLHVDFTITEAQLTATGPIELTITANNESLGTTTITGPGAWNYVWKSIDAVPINTPIRLELSVTPTWKQQGQDYGLEVTSISFQN